MISRSPRLKPELWEHVFEKTPPNLQYQRRPPAYGSNKTCIVLRTTVMGPKHPNIAPLSPRISRYLCSKSGQVLMPWVKNTTKPANQFNSEIGLSLIRPGPEVMARARAGPPLC